MSLVAKGETVAQDPASPDLWIVVPVYNEAENFPLFRLSLKEKVRTRHTLVVVYDFDEDTTLPAVKAAQREDASIVLLKNESRGVLGALKTGLAYPTHGAIVVSMADCSDDHSRVDEMYELYRQGKHVVAASRYSPGGKQLGGPLMKKTLSRLAGTSLHWAGIPTRDATNNFKLYSKELIDRVVIESVGGFEVALELTVKAHELGMPIGEVPATWTDRVAGKSNFKLWKWLPRYMRWYGRGVAHRISQARAS